MKIICIEEHTVDAAIAKASQQGQAAEAGYMRLRTSARRSCRPKSPWS
jgi:hypothetical protein